MRIEDFTVHFKKQKKVLYRYFLKMIRENTSYCGDLHPLVRDFMVLTFTDAYLKVLEGGLSRLQVHVIIMIKAKDIFFDAIRKPKKKPRLEEMTPDVYDKASSDPDPYQRLVLREDMETLNSLLDDASRLLLEDKVDRIPGPVTAENLKITSSTMKTRRYRLRKNLQQRLEKGY